MQRARCCCWTIERTLHVVKPLSCSHSLILQELVKGVVTTVYMRKFGERPGELTPRNLDHPVPVGLVDIGGRRALIYGNPWRGLSPHHVSVLHPTDCKQDNQHCSLAFRACGRSCTDFPHAFGCIVKMSFFFVAYIKIQKS